MMVMAVSLFAFLACSTVGLVQAAPFAEGGRSDATSALRFRARAGVTNMTAEEIVSYKPYSMFARVGYCSPAVTATWTCGEACDELPGFIPYASGGDGSSTQYWYVGYDPVRLGSVVVGHQGTDGFIASLIDADFALTGLNAALFPGVPSTVLVHNGFESSHSRSAPAILAAVTSVLASTGSTKVTLVGHSLGAALALLDAVYLPLHLPSSTTITARTYGLPRVGNAAFADYVDAHVAGFAHVNSRKDIVPILPPRGLGYQHPAGEKHILEDDSWVACAGHDNTDTQCSTGMVSSIFVGDPNDHDGPYDGIMMGSDACSL